MDASTPRDGSSPNPFEQDTTKFAKSQNQLAASPCGSTKLGGENDVTSQLAAGKYHPATFLRTSSVVQSGGAHTKADPTSVSLAASASGLPTAAADGTVTMTLHQVNQDGAGPYTCQADATGTGTAFADMTVTQQVPGKNVPVIGSLSTAKATNFTLAAQMPAGTTCSGAGGACLVRCMNAAIGE